MTGLHPALDPASAKMQENEPQTRKGQSVLHLRPVVDLSQVARTTSTVVFVEERRNLYIDTVSEAEGWAELLIRLDSCAWPTSLASELETWTIEGFAHILEIVRTSMDGALSLTSKPEVFDLFTRVILAAKVLLMRHEFDFSSKERGEVHVCAVLLEKLLDLGKSRLSHDLLLHRIQVILGEVGLPTS